MNIKNIHLKQTNSTSTYLKEQNLTGGIDDMFVVTADYQTAGRGQGTNSWESEPGKNLLFSIQVHPVMVPIARQFLLSMAGALAVKSTLDAYTGGITLKWPNDVYWNDKKISGTIIENTLSGGHITRCIYGIGINVNQEAFHSDAPNPVSLFQILHHTVDRDELLKQFLDHFEKYFNLIVNGDYTDIAAFYHEALYRRHGYYKFQTADGIFDASIVEVEDDGHLVLHDREGHISRYAFKEIEFVI